MISAKEAKQLLHKDKELIISMALKSIDAHIQNAARVCDRVVVELSPTEWHYVNIIMQTIEQNGFVVHTLDGKRINIIWPND